MIRDNWPAYDKNITLTEYNSFVDAGAEYSGKHDCVQHGAILEKE